MENVIQLPPLRFGDNEVLGTFHFIWEGIGLQSLESLGLNEGDFEHFYSICVHWQEIHGDRQEPLGVLNVHSQRGMASIGRHPVQPITLSLQWIVMFNGNGVNLGAFVMENPLQSRMIGNIHVMFESNVYSDGPRYLGTILLGWRGHDQGDGFLFFQWERRNGNISQLVQSLSPDNYSFPQSTGAISLPWPGENIIRRQGGRINFYMDRIRNESDQFLLDLGGNYSQQYLYIGHVTFYYEGRVNRENDVFFGGVSVLIHHGLPFPVPPPHIWWI